MANGRLEIGEPLRDFRGILSGVPVYEPGLNSTDVGKMSVESHVHEY